jgi:hypothetical protein
MKRSQLEQKICGHCEHDFGEHEDCKRCERDRKAAQIQRAMQRHGPRHRGVSVGNVLSHHVRPLVCRDLAALLSADSDETA